MGHHHSLGKGPFGECEGDVSHRLPRRVYERTQGLDARRSPGRPLQRAHNGFLKLLLLKILYTDTIPTQLLHIDPKQYDLLIQGKNQMFLIWKSIPAQALHYRLKKGCLSRILPLQFQMSMPLFTCITRSAP
jgi:hypothetical protein